MPENSTTASSPGAHSHDEDEHDTSFHWHIRPKILFFFCFLAGCAAFPYVPLIYRQELHLREDQIGLITAITPFVAAVSAPLGTWLVDVTRRKLLILSVTAILASVAQWGLMIPNLGFVGSCVVAAIQSFFGAPFFPLLDALVLDLLGKDKEAYGQQRLFAAISCGMTYVMTSGLIKLSGSLFAAFAAQTFWTVVFIGVLLLVAGPWALGVAAEGYEPIKDDITDDLDASGADAVPPLANPVVEAVVPKRIVLEIERDVGEVDGERDEAARTPPPPPPAVTSALDAAWVDEDAPLLATARGNSGAVPAVTDGEEEADLVNSYAWIFRRDTIVFLTSMAVLGTSFVVVQGFLWIFLVEYKRATPLLLGMTGPFSIAVEIPFFFYSKQILLKLGMQNSIILGHLAMLVRLLLYTILPSGDGAWLVLGIELLHGFSFSLMWTAAVKFANEMAPASLSATAQGLLNGAHFGLGFGVGAIVAGYVYARLGPLAMFRGAAAALAVSAFVFWIVGPKPLKLRG
ncbi:hypothetical protein HK101_011207 [Irineochytrium annulatum]|nr:hypothetical protein HK101_011207 [Irineochytrium annulatum]